MFRILFDKCFFYINRCKKIKIRRKFLAVHVQRQRITYTMNIQMVWSPVYDPKPQIATITILMVSLPEYFSFESYC